MPLYYFANVVGFLFLQIRKISNEINCDKACQKESTQKKKAKMKHPTPQKPKYKPPHLTSTEAKFLMVETAAIEYI